MKRYKIMIILLSFIFLISASGCSQGSSKGKKSSEASKKTIKIATFYSDKEQVSIYKDIVKDFEVKNKDIKVELETDFGNEEKIKESLSQKQGYDVIGLKRNQVIEFARSGLLQDMSDLAGKNAYNKRLFNINLAYGTYNGKVYGIGDMPMSMEWFYNKDMFKSNGYKEPSTLGELASLCKKIKSRKVIPIGIGAIDGWALTSFFGMITSQTSGVNELTTLYGSDKMAFQKVNSLNNAFNIYGKLIGTCILRNSDEVNYRQSVQDFVSGKVAILPAGSWATALIEKIKPTGFNYGVFQNVVRMTNLPKSLYSTTAGQVLSIPANSKNAKEANKFIEFLFSDEAQKKFTEKGYTASLVSANIPTSDLEKNILNHIGAADENSIMLMDNLEPTMLQNLTMVLKDVLTGQIKPEDAWSRVLKLTFQQ